MPFALQTEGLPNLRQGDEGCSLRDGEVEYRCSSCDEIDPLNLRLCAARSKAPEK